MDLDYVKSHWARLKAHEAELQKQLDGNQEAQKSFFREAIDEGFYQQDGEWLKNESCSNCKHCTNGSCFNENSGMYLEVVNLFGSCLRGWEPKEKVN